MDHQQIEALIHKTFLFRDVDEFLVEQMVSDPRCYLVEYDKNDIIYERQAYHKSLGVILSGKIRAEKENGFYLSSLHAGDLFGAAAMFHEGKGYINRLVAMNRCSVFYIPQEVLQWIMRRDYRIAETYISYLSGRILFLNQKLDVLSAGSADQKLAMYLLRNGDISCTMTELSGQLNLGRASLYRAIEALEAADLIRQEQKKIHILDIERLQDYIKGDRL